MARNSLRKTLGLWVIGIVAIAIIGYGAFEARFLIDGPKLSLLSPISGQETNNQLLEVRGEASNIAHISLNDRQIYIDETGVFKETLLLSPGYNRIRVRARDKFGRETEKVAEIVYTPKNS